MVFYDFFEILDLKFAAFVLVPIMVDVPTEQSEFMPRFGLATVGASG